MKTSQEEPAQDVDHQEDHLAQPMAEWEFEDHQARVNAEHDARITALNATRDASSSASSSSPSHANVLCDPHRKHDDVTLVQEQRHKESMRTRKETLERKRREETCPPRADFERFRSTRHVSFLAGGDEVHEITPYAEVYGIHPKEFDFDANGSLVSRDHGLLLDDQIADAEVGEAAPRDESSGRSSSAEEANVETDRGRGREPGPLGQEVSRGSDRAGHEGGASRADAMVAADSDSTGTPVADGVNGESDEDVCSSTGPKIELIDLSGETVLANPLRGVETVGQLRALVLKKFPNLLKNDFVLVDTKTGCIMAEEEDATVTCDTTLMSKDDSNSDEQSSDGCNSRQIYITLQPSKLCKCGCVFRKRPASTIYRSGEVECDGCLKRFRDETEIYTCPDGKTNAHARGYDICENCIDKFVRIPELPHRCR